MKAAHMPNKQKGAAIVETTIVLPIMILLFLAICELGRAFYTYNTLNKTMQNGARHLASTTWFVPSSSANLDYSAPDGNAYQATNLILYGNVNPQSDAVVDGFNAGDITFSIPTPGFVQVDISYSYIPVIGPVLYTFGFGSNVNLNFTMNSSITVPVL